MGQLLERNEEPHRSPVALPTDWVARAPSGIRGRARETARVLLERSLPPSAYCFARRRYHQMRRVLRCGPGRGRVLPDFLIIGVVKGGTTTLCAWVNEHSFVAPAAQKESHFFDFHFALGADLYRSNFPRARERRRFAAEHGRPFLTGEASASYFSSACAPARIAHMLPDVRLIVAFRDPVDRAYSHFQMARRSDEEPLASFEEAIRIEDERLRPELARVAADPLYFSWPLGAWSYLLRSRYAEHLERWFDLFRRDRFHFVKTEDLSLRPQQALNGVYRFLGLPDHELDAYPSFHVASYPPMAAETRTMLEDYFRPHNERLYELVGIDFGWEADLAGRSRQHAR